MLVPSTGKLLQAFWFVNLSHSEIFDDVLCWCLLQASFCKHFDLSIFHIQKYLMMFCVGALYGQAFANILICQPFSFSKIWWCFVLAPSTGKLLQAIWLANLSHSEIFDDVCVGAFYRQAFASILICQPFSFRNIWWCFVLVPSTGKLLQAFWFVNLSHSEIFDDVLCWCLLQASFCKHFDLPTFLIQKYLMMFSVGAFYRQAFASILICQPFSFRNRWWCFVLVPSTGKLLQAFWFVNLSHSEIFDDVLCWCLLQASFWKHFDLSTFLIQKNLMMFCVGAFYRQAFASILICQPFSFRNIWWCFVLVPSTGKLLQAFWFVNPSHSEIFDDVLCWRLLQASFCKHFDFSTFLIEKYLVMFCVGAFYRQAFASILICQPFSFRNIWWCFVLVPSTRKLLQASWFVNLSHSEIFWWCFVLVPSTGKLLQAFWCANLSHSEIFDDVLCWYLLQASFCKHFDLSTFLIQNYLMMFCVGAFYRQAFASILICQPFSFRNIWWCFVLVPSESILSAFLIEKYLVVFCVGAFYRQAFASILICQPFSFRNIWWCFVLVPSTGKLLQAFWFVNLSHSEIFHDVLCWRLLQASFCKHVDLSTFLIQKYLMMFCVGAFYRQAFASILICQPFSFRNIWWCFVLVPSTGKLLQACWFVNLSHSEIFDDVLCWCLLQASFCKHFDVPTFLIQKYLTMFCVGAFYRQAFANILIFQPFSLRNIWWCFVLVPSTGKLLQAFWFVNLSHSEIFDDVLCWCLLQASFCKHFDLSTFLIQKYFGDVLCWCLLQASFCKHFDVPTFLIQKYLMMFCVGAFYRQAFASILICQPFSFRTIWWCFVLVPSTGKLLQAFWFVNLSHSEIFDDVLCWCLLQASFCKHFDLPTFLIQKYLTMFCVGAFYRQAFASILICQPFSFRNIWWCFVLAPSTGKLLQACWFVNLSHSEIFDDVLCWCLLQASFCKHFDLSTFLIQKYLMMFCVGAFYRQAFASILICQPFSGRNVWWCYVSVPSTGRLLQAFWFVNLSHSEKCDDVLCWASFGKHFDLSTFLIQKYLMMFCVGAFYRQVFASILICQPFSFRNIWWCFVLVPSTRKLLQAFWFVNLSHSEIFDDVLCWCLLQASFCKHFDFSTFLIQKYLMMFCVGAFYRQAFASILIFQPFSFRNIWWCFVLVPSTGKLLQAFWFVNLSHSEIFDDVLCWCLLQASFCKHFDFSTFLIQKYLMMFCVGAFYRQAFASILICQPFSFRNIWWCFVLVPSTGKLLHAFWFVNLSHSEIFDDVCVGAFYRQAFASILICQPFSFRNIWWCYVLVPSTGKLLHAFWFVNLSHSEILDDVLCWCLLQASFCKQFDLSTFLIQKSLMMFCFGAFYRQAFASILICQPFSFRNLWWCFVLVSCTGKLLQAFWFVNLSHSEIFDDVLCWCLLHAIFCKRFDSSTFLIQKNLMMFCVGAFYRQAFASMLICQPFIQKYLMMFCVGAFYRQAFASSLICQPFSFRNIWWCFVLVSSTGKLLQAFWFVNLSHSERFDDVLCWCHQQASFRKHFDLSTFLIQKNLMIFCAGAFYRQAFASILICQPFSFRNIWWCFVLVPSTGKLLQAFWFVNLSHSEIFDDVLCWCLLQASFCKHFDLSTFLRQKCVVMLCVGAFYRQAFASILICQPFSFRNIWWCFVLVPSTGKLLQAFWFVNLSHSEIFDDVLCWFLVQASFCKHFDLSTFLIQKYLMMFCVGAFYTQAFASALIRQPFSFINIWWCFVLVPSTGKLLQACWFVNLSFKKIWWCFVLAPSTGKLLQAFWFVNLSQAEICGDVLCWCLLQASFCKHFDLSTFLIQKNLMMFCVGAFYRQAFASILICQPFSGRNMWWCFVLVPSTGRLLQAFWFVNLSHSEKCDDVLCWCLLQASFCKHFDLSTFLIQKYLMMFCVGAFYRQAFASILISGPFSFRNIWWCFVLVPSESILICQPFSFRNIWWCFVLVPSTGKLLQAFWFVNLSQAEICGDVLCWCLLQAGFCKHFDLSTFLIQKYLMMFCVGAFYRQAFASMLIRQPFSFRNIWWCFVLVPSTGKLLQAFWFVNLSHSEIFDDVLCWCLLQASFCKHFDLSTFLIQKNVMMFCVGQAFASILICQPFSFRNIWWCFVLVPSTGKFLQACWFANLSHSEIFDDVLCWCLLHASFCKHFDLSTFLIQKYLMMFCVGAFYRQAFASILIFQPFSFRNIWWCFVLVPSTGKLLQAFWFVNLSHSEIFDDVLCWCLLQASFCKHFDLSTFLIQKYLMMFCVGAFYRQAFASILIFQPFSFRNIWWCLCWCLLQASFCKHFDLSTFLIQKYLMMFCVGAFHRQAFARILICQPFIQKNLMMFCVGAFYRQAFASILICQPFSGRTFLRQKYVVMFCVGAFYRQAFASILICQPFSFRKMWWCFVLVPSTGKLLQAFWFVNLSQAEICGDVLCWCLLQASFCKHFD